MTKGRCVGAPGPCNGMMPDGMMPAMLCCQLKVRQHRLGDICSTCLLVSLPSHGS